MIDYGSPTLNLANKVRLDRARMRRDIRSGRLDPVEVLRNRDDGVPIMYVLRSIERVGQISAAKLLNLAGLPEHLTLGDTNRKGYRAATDRERNRIADLVATGRRQVQKVAA